MLLDTRAAKNYNQTVQGVLWEPSELPAPLDHASLRADPDAFVFAIAAFQAAIGLRADGKLGPSTLAALQEFEPYGARGEGCPDDADSDGEPADQEATELSGAPARTGVSNVLIINGIDIPLTEEQLAMGLTCSNWRDDAEKHFKARDRTEPMRHFVLHESVTTSVAATIRVLDAKRKRKGWDYGIHFNLGPDGHIVQHNDPVLDRLVHANHLNDSSAGVEITNPYNPKFGGAPWVEVIPGPWWCWRPKGASRVYTVPTPRQMRAVAPLCRLLAEHCPDLPMAFPTRELNSRRKRIQGWSDGVVPPAGFIAHRDFASHADGRYPLEHLIARVAS